MATVIDLERMGAGPANTDASAAAEHLNLEGWQLFLQEEIEKTLHVFRTKPKLLLSQVRDERQIADDYAGRELLELVQNAADAAAERGGMGRVRIEIDRDGLIVANTGQPFRTGGVESLMTPHASDKPRRAAKLIGAKGLGFRALLNWSHEPIVSSGELEIGFSEKHAATFITDLAGSVPQIAAICADEEDSPVPLLAFPAFGEAMECLGNAAHARLLERARALRAAGYDTVVAAPFDGEAALGWALKQAAEFSPTFLLFVEALREIELEVAGSAPVRWERTRSAKDTYILTIQNGAETDTQEWICLRKSGALAARGRSKPRLYELAVAFRCPVSAPSYLHSYFPTSIPVPFPALFHATLELDSNRKAIKQNSEVNQGVLAELASFYAASLARLVKSRRTGNALDFLARAASFPEPLKEFEQAVYRAVRPLKVIPTMSGERVCAENARLGPAGYQSYLPGRLFGNLARCRGPEDRAALERLDVKVLSAPGILQALRRAELTLEERANAIVGVAANLNSKFHDRGLFLDENLQPMQGKNTLFPPPAGSERLPRLPDWAKARFIHPDLWKLVLRRTEGQNPREKLRRLGGYGISEYSNESVITSLRSQAARALQGGRRDADTVQRELLGAVHSLYSPEFRTPPGTLKVRCRDGLWRDAREAHLSEGFGQAGRINAELYRSAPEHLLGTAHENGVDADAGNLAAFFEWIGVHRWPRAEPVSVLADQRAIVFRALPEEITVEDGNSHQTFKKSEISWEYNFRATCVMIVGLSGILATAASDAVLAWLALDPRFDLSAPHRFATSARGRKDGKANYRAYLGTLPDLVRERIATTPWLACRNDQQRSPRGAMIEPGNLLELFHVPRPALIGSEERYGLNQYIWRRGLEHAQVPRTLADLAEGSIFALMKELPSRGASDATVRALYNQVLARDSFDSTKASGERVEFLTHGKVQVHIARERKWVTPAEALYADQSSLPAAVREALALIDLPSRKSTVNVLDRFGVAALSQRKYTLEVTSLVEERGAAAAMLRAEFAAARPFIRALRLADANLTSRLRRFDRLALQVVTAAEIAVKIGDRTLVGPVAPWTHILHDDTLLIAIETGHQPAQISVQAHEATADGIAELFDLQSGADFAKLLSAQDDGHRRFLLRRMLPNLPEAEIIALLADIPAPEDEYQPVKVEPATLLQGPLFAPESTAIPGDATLPPAFPTPGGPPSAAGRPENPDAITSTAIALGPVAPPWQATPARTIRLRVARATGPLSSTAHPDPYRAADAEEWTRLFEISQGRFPLAVLHLLGRDSFGCDWLSFSSEADRQTFVEDSTRTEIVARFIETKSGSIELSDNQSRAAERWGVRYFIYRVHFYAGQRDEAELTIVANPLSHRQALLARFEFRIDAVETREMYQLFPEGPVSDDTAKV